MPIDPTTRLHLEDLARLRRVTGWALLGGPLAFGVAALAAGLACGMRMLLALGVLLLAAAGALASLRAMLAWRERELARRAEDPSAMRARAPFAARAWPYALAAGLLLAATFRWWAPALAAAVPGLEPWSRLRAPDAQAAEAARYGWLALGAALVAAVLAQYFHTAPRAIAPEARGAACWLRASTWLALAAALVLFLRAYWRPWREETFAQWTFAAIGFLGAELLLRALWTSWLGFYDKRPHPGAKVATDLFSLRLVFSRFNPSASLFAVLADSFGIDLRGAWALTFIRRSLVPLAVGLALVGWLSTALVAVAATDVGLLERFGRLERGELLEPGLHVVLPRPLHRVIRVPLHRVQTIPIGFTGARAGAGMLWTVAHADEEYQLLLGDGRDLVTINASLHYKVSDPYAYVYGMQNPDEALAIAADRVLMTKTVMRSLDDVLSENLGAVAADFRAAIQAAADQAGLGIEIVDFTLMGLHPPVDVAADYQAVVAAQIERETRVLEARAYENEELPRAEGDAARFQNDALGASVTRLAEARGEALAFDALRASHALAPELFRRVWRLERLETFLEGRRFHLIDHTIERDGGAIWILE